MIYCVVAADELWVSRHVVLPSSTGDKVITHLSVILSCFLTFVTFL